jgi:hypothetical protein
MGWRADLQAFVDGLVDDRRYHGSATIEHAHQGEARPLRLRAQCISERCVTE